METEIRIQVPEGMEIDRKNSTFECIKFKPKELTTYRDISEKYCRSSIIRISYEHNDKMFIFRKLLEVADYLNGDWKPDWNDRNQYKYFITYNGREEKFYIRSRWDVNEGIIYFSSKENAEKAIDIIGEEELKQFYL